MPWSTQLSLQLHYWICEACARYRDQLRAIRSALRRTTAQSNGEDPVSPLMLSPEAQERLKRELGKRRL
jgi:hypothetical protein